MDGHKEIDKRMALQANTLVVGRKKYSFVDHGTDVRIPKAVGANHWGDRDDGNTG